MMKISEKLFHNANYDQDVRLHSTVHYSCNYRIVVQVYKLLSNTHKLLNSYKFLVIIDNFENRHYFEYFLANNLQEIADNFDDNTVYNGANERKDIYELLCEANTNFEDGKLFTTHITKSEQDHE